MHVCKTLRPSQGQGRRGGGRRPIAHSRAKKHPAAEAAQAAKLGNPVGHAAVEYIFGIFGEWMVFMIFYDHTWMVTDV